MHNQKRKAINQKDSQIKNQNPNQNPRQNNKYILFLYKAYGTYFGPSTFHLNLITICLLARCLSLHIILYNTVTVLAKFVLLELEKKGEMNQREIKKKGKLLKQNYKLKRR